MARMRKVNSNGTPPGSPNDRPDLDTIADARAGRESMPPAILGPLVGPLPPSPPLGLPPRRVAASARAKAQGLCCDYTKAPWFDGDGE